MKSSNDMGAATMSAALQRLRIRLISGIIAATALIATTAWTSGSPQSAAGFICDNGDRFVVEFLADHVRLRDGTGVFALATVTPGKIYSDGLVVLHTGTGKATLERPGTALLQHCILAS
jgi:hypothetical protein